MERRYNKKESRLLLESERSCEALSQKICYCFHCTDDDIREDIGKNGRSTIMERIREAKKKGGCQCKTLNPKGT